MKKLLLILLLFCPVIFNAAGRTRITKIFSPGNDTVQLTLRVVEKIVNTKKNLVLLVDAKNRSDQTIYVPDFSNIAVIGMHLYQKQGDSCVEVPLFDHDPTLDYVLSAIDRNPLEAENSAKMTKEFQKQYEMFRDYLDKYHGKTDFMTAEMPYFFNPGETLANVSILDLNFAIKRKGDYKIVFSVGKRRLFAEWPVEIKGYKCLESGAIVSNEVSFTY